MPGLSLSVLYKEKECLKLTNQKYEEVITSNNKWLLEATRVATALTAVAR